ncbi:MAG: hypothetical protein FJ265_03210 [Planctomycetes bacterium]|nr:hypothetical protein [Planctomycetota bacterium]
MNLWTAALQLLQKDLRLYFRDRAGMVLGFLLPVGLVTVFGYVMQVAFGGGSAMPKAELWVADEDGSAASVDFVAQLRKADTIVLRPKTGSPPEPAAALRDKVRDGDAHHVLVIGVGFGDALARAAKPPLEMVRDPGRQMEDYAVQIGVMQAFLAVSEGRLWPVTMGETMRGLGMSAPFTERLVGLGRDMQGLIEKFGGGEEPAARDPAVPARPGGFDLRSMFTTMVPMTTTDVTPPARPKQLSYQVAQSVAGMAVMMLMFGLMACSTTLLQERDQGTLRRLLVARMPRGAIVLGKFLFCFVVGLLQMAVLFGYGELVFGVGCFRDPLTLLMLTLAWAACATSFGMLIAVAAKTGKQAEGLSTLLILLMAALGGCWFPIQIAQLPWYGELVTQSTLTWWAMTGFQGMFWQQLSWTHPTLLLCLAVQWGFALLGGGAALWLFRRRYLRG